MACHFKSVYFNSYFSSLHLHIFHLYLTLSSLFPCPITVKRIGIYNKILNKISMENSRNPQCLSKGLDLTL